MKTVISVDDSLMKEADAADRELGLSRNGLNADALREYRRRRRETQISAQLNDAYAGGSTEEERRLVRKMGTKFPLQDRW